MGARRRGRELAFQILYQMDLGSLKIDEALGRFKELERAKVAVRVFAEELARGAEARLPELDALIAARSLNWNFLRLASVERALLRLGAFELLHCDDIPAEVTINECIELAKKYGDGESPAFVNGILDQILQSCAPAKLAGR